MGLGLWSETMPEAMPSAMLSFECCNRLCRLPEQEWLRCAQCRVVQC